MTFWHRSHGLLIPNEPPKQVIELPSLKRLVLTVSNAYSRLPNVTDFPGLAGATVSILNGDTTVAIHYERDPKATDEDLGWHRYPYIPEVVVGGDFKKPDTMKVYVHPAQTVKDINNQAVGHSYGPSVMVPLNAAVAEAIAKAWAEIADWCRATNREQDLHARVEYCEVCGEPAYDKYSEFTSDADAPGDADNHGRGHRQ